MTKFQQGQKIRVADPNIVGGGSHYGKVEDITKDMFDGTPLYIVKTKDGVKTYKEESIKSLKR